MNKILFFFLCFVLSSNISAQNKLSRQQRYQQQVAEINEARTNCPVPFVPDQIIMMDIYFADSYLTYKVDFLTDLYWENAHNGILKKSFIKSYSMAEQREVLSFLQDFNFGIKYLCKKRNTGENTVITISPEEIKQIHTIGNNPIDDARLFLEEFVSNTKDEQIERGLMQKKASLVDGYLEFRIVFDESLIAYEDVLASKQALVAELTPQPKGENLVFDLILEHLSTLGYKLKYKYIGSSSKKYLDIIINPINRTTYVLPQ